VVGADTERHTGRQFAVFVKKIRMGRKYLHSLIARPFHKGIAGRIKERQAHSVAAFGKERFTGHIGFCKIASFGTDYFCLGITQFFAGLFETIGPQTDSRMI